VYGFGQDFKIVTLRGGSGQQRSRIVVPGDEENAALRELLSDRDGRFDPTHALHHHVSDQVLKGSRPSEFQTLLTAVGHCGCESADVEHHRERIGVNGIVIDDEHFGFGGFHRNVLNSQLNPGCDETMLAKNGCESMSRTLPLTLFFR
jgi:hypothetical protein